MKNYLKIFIPLALAILIGGLLTFAIVTFGDNRFCAAESEFR